MSIANKLPSVLFQPNGNSVSVERILKTAAELILQLHPEGPITNDRIVICLDDLETLWKNLD